MPSKGTQNFMDGLTGLFGKKETPQEKMRNEQNKLAKDRASEQKMIAQLNVIAATISDARRRGNLTIDPQQIEKCERLIRLAISELKNPPIHPYNIEKIDEHMIFVLYAMDRAVKENHQEMLEYAAAGLYRYLTNLRAEIPEMDMQYADDLLDKRVLYAENLRTLLQQTRAYEDEKKSLEEHKKSKEAKEKVFAALTAELKAYQETAEGMKAADDLQRYAGNQSLMPAEAQKYQNRLFERARMKSDLLTLSVTIKTADAGVQAKSAEIGTLKISLQELPTVTDPQIQERIKKANEDYVLSLQKRLNVASESMKDFAQFQSKISSLQDHEIFAYMATIAKNEQDEMSLEELKKQQGLKETVARMKRAAQEKENIRLEELKLRRELEEAQERISELEQLEQAESETQEDYEENDQLEEIWEIV